MRWDEMTLLLMLCLCCVALVVWLLGYGTYHTILGIIYGIINFRETSDIASMIWYVPTVLYHTIPEDMIDFLLATS